MSLTSLYRSHGALQFPSADTDETTLASLDPARDVLLALFKAALNDELAARWTDAASGTPLAGTSPVSYALPHEPSLEVVQEVKTSLPLLCVYREPGEQTVDDISLWQTQLTCKWGVDYIIGTLDAGDRRKLADVITAAGKLLIQVVEMGGHRAYATDNAGKQHKLVLVGSASECQFSTCRVTQFSSGVAQFSDGSPKYHSLSLTIETTELDGFIANGYENTHEGASLALGTGNDDGILFDLLLADTDTE